MSNYTKEFKLEAIRLLESKKVAGTDLARELGVKREMLYRWQEEFHAKGPEAFPGRGRPPKNNDDLAALRRELAEVKEERDILKKAAIYFAKEVR